MRRGPKPIPTKLKLARCSRWVGDLTNRGNETQPEPKPPTWPSVQTAFTRCATPKPADIPKATRPCLQLSITQQKKLWHCGDSPIHIGA